MQPRTFLWAGPLLLYMLVAYWYTNTGGPLTVGEIESYVERLKAAGYAPAQVARLRTFMENDSGRQFLMLNNIDMNEDPGDVDGAEPGETAGQLMNRYMEHMYPELFKRACHPVYLGAAVFSAMDIVGIEGAEHWDTAVLMRYRSRRDLLQITANPEFQGKHHFKLAALDKTIAYPLENTLYLSDPRLLLALVLMCLVALLDIGLFGRKR